MRRKEGAITQIEQTILEAALRLKREGFEECHGFQIAKKIKELSGARFLIGYGTLYRALGRLRQQGLLEARWEDVAPDDRSGARRRYYHLTAAGAEILEHSVVEHAPKTLDLEVSEAI